MCGVYASEITGYPIAAANAQHLPRARSFATGKGVVRFINAAYAKYLGLRPEETIGRHITELIPTSGIPAVLRSRKAELRQIRRFPNGGATLIVNRVPLFGDDGIELIGALSMTLFDTADQVRDLLEHVRCPEPWSVPASGGSKAPCLRPIRLNPLSEKAKASQPSNPCYCVMPARTRQVLILGATEAARSWPRVPFMPPVPAPVRSCINCAAIPKDLFESEVFGYAPGAFSGARKEGSVGKIG